jgi:hypothetical protein
MGENASSTSAMASSGLAEAEDPPGKRIADTAELPGDALTHARCAGSG